jgi:two-component system chemotaxis sensor kinase CheA
MAIMDGMITEVGGERYILPTLAVRESLRPKAEDCKTVMGKGEMIKVHGRLIPLFRLAHLFSLKEKARDINEGIVIVLENRDKQVSVLVDDLLGQQQVVIKNLGTALGTIPGISGGAIMSDGNISLILDVAEIIQMST